MAIKIIKDNNEYNEQIYEVVSCAFKQQNEADLVEGIKAQSDYYISYLAIADSKVVGHVLISPMLLNGVDDVLCLAPVSVLDEYSNKGIGSLLIKTALSDAFKNNDYKIITVLGSDHYYNRFGFEGYNEKRFKLPFEVEARFFQLMEIKEGILKDLEGIFDYPSYFDL